MLAFVAEEFRKTFVEIREAGVEDKLVTCIEVLSPSNKRPGTQGWELYQRKRQGLLLGAANLVELDLLRGGKRLPMIDHWPPSPYTLLVAHKTFAPACRVWPGHFLHPLPPIPVPLLKPDSDISLHIQPMIESIHVHFRYVRNIDYSKALTPPLSTEELTWLRRQFSPQKEIGNL